MPLAGTFALAAGLLILQFDRPLQPGPLDLGNWAVRANNNIWTAATIDPALPNPDEVTGTFNPAVPAGGGTAVSYTPPPLDLHSAFGVPAAQFLNFPLTLLP